MEGAAPARRAVDARPPERRAYRRDAHALQLRGLLRSLRNARRARERAVAEAVERERERMAVDLHDLVMQDLALAVSQARALPSAQGQETVRAGERALAAARRLVEDLGRTDASPLGEAVGTAVALAARSASVTYEPPQTPTPAVTRELQETLVHIGRESVTNAVSHGCADAVWVCLSREEDMWCLEVGDNGTGFDPSSTQGGFGLLSMRAQAAVLGGEFEVLSTPGRGAWVRALIP